MSEFLATLRAELFVSLRSSGSRIIVLAPALIVLCQYGLVQLSSAGQQVQASLLGASEFENLSANNAYGYFVDGLVTGLTVLSFFLVALAAYSFSAERDSGTLRHLPVRRSRRSNIVLAKLLNLHLLALLSLLLLLFISYSFSALLWDFGAIVEDGFELISEAEMRQEILLGLRLAIVPLPAAIACGLLISVCAQTSTQAVTTALGVAVALDIFKSLLGNGAYYVYATFQPSLIDQSYLNDV
ncbi:MAG: ABC transporter permease subunit, partial [Gammaproteobacteria bacterium]